MEIRIFCLRMFKKMIDNEGRRGASSPERQSDARVKK